MAPTTTRSEPSGTQCTMAGPTAATTTPSTTMAATAPSSADRQPRPIPAATTMVRASTISTALARNTATIRTMALELTLTP